MSHVENGIAFGVLTHAAEASHHLLVAVVEVDAFAGEPVEQVCVFLLHRDDFGGRCAQAVERFDAHLAHYAFDRVDDQQIAYRSALVQHHAQPREVVFDVLIFFPPGGLVEDAGRVVPFGLAFHRVPRQVVTAHVDAEQRLPVADGLVVRKVELPAGAAVQFRQQPFFVQLTGGGRELFDHPVGVVVLGQHVDARVVLVFVETHQRTLHGHLVRETVFVQHMAGIDHVVFRTPIVLRLGEVFQEQRLYQVAVLPFGVVDPFAVFAQENFRQFGGQVFSVCLFVLFRQFRRPRNVVDAAGHSVGFAFVRGEQSAAVRFVGEDPLDVAAEPGAAVFFILIVR